MSILGKIEPQPPSKSIKRIAAWPVRFRRWKCHERYTAQSPATRTSARHWRWGRRCNWFADRLDEELVSEAEALIEKATTGELK